MHYSLVKILFVLLLKSFFLFVFFRKNPFFSSQVLCSFSYSLNGIRGGTALRALAVEIDPAQLIRS